MLEAVMGQVVFASKDELTIDAVDFVERTLDVVVLSDLIPRREVFVAVFTKRVRQLVVFVIRIRDNLSAIWTFNLQLFKNILDHSTNRLEIAYRGFAFFIHTSNSPFIYIFLLETRLTVAAHATATLQWVSEEVIANATRGQGLVFRVLNYACILNITRLNCKFLGGHYLLASMSCLQLLSGHDFFAEITLHFSFLAVQLNMHLHVHCSDF